MSPGTVINFNDEQKINKGDIIDEITMKNIQRLCLPEVKEYTPEKIVSIRKKLKLSQAALASIFNISPSTVQKWEQGHKKIYRMFKQALIPIFIVVLAQNPDPNQDQYQGKKKLEESIFQDIDNSRADIKVVHYNQIQQELGVK